MLSDVLAEDCEPVESYAYLSQLLKGDEQKIHSKMTMESFGNVALPYAISVPKINMIMDVLKNIHWVLS